MKIIKYLAKQLMERIYIKRNSRIVWNVQGEWRQKAVNGGQLADTETEHHLNYRLFHGIVIGKSALISHAISTEF